MNTNKAGFEGVEFEAEVDFYENWRLTGSLSHQVNSDSTGASDVGFIPNFMAKTGLNYTADSGGSIGLFASHFGDSASFPQASQFNPPADSYNWLTLKASSTLARLNFPRTRLNLFIDNLLNEHVYFPEINFRNVNTLPLRPGISVFGSITVQF
jgi:outer membrane receptor for ferrienterochelin and colicin